MTQLFTNRFILLTSALLLCVTGLAQKKLLVLGSSTSACFGPTSYDNCYLGRLQKHYQDMGTPITIDNRAVGGYNCYMAMPTGYTPPPNRESPRPYFNITSGLEGNPDIILVNFPSNGYDIFSVDEVLFCLRTIKQTANNAGKPCYITTTQPRSDPESYRTGPVRRKMAEIKQRVLNEFGQYAINFWDGIVNPADTSILNSYDADGVHLNNAGHGILYNRVLEKNIFNQPLPDNTPPSPPGNLRVTGTGNTFLNLDWDNSTDNVSVAGYEVFVNNVKKYTSTSSDIVADNLAPATSYSFSVRAFDQAGNVSSFSNIVSASTTGSTTTGGLTYRYYEGDWNALPDFNALSPVASGNAANVSLEPRNRNDRYGFVWEGQINIPTPGTYTFELISDDGSKLYFNAMYSHTANALVNNDGLHPVRSAYGSINIPAAGAYPIAFTFFEKDGGESMQVYWSGPGISRQQVPNSAFTQNPPSPANGLRYRYYEGDWNVLPDFNALTPAKAGNTANIDLSNRNRNDHYGFVWEGQINMPAPGNYTFELVSDDGSKLYFNSLYAAGANALVNNDGLHAERSAFGNVSINAAGAYPIAITFFEKDGGELIRVYWSGPGIPRQLIPASAFSPNPSSGGLAYRYYEGDWNALPDFNALSPAKSGNTANVDLSPRTRNDHFGFVWEGRINMPAQGDYTFELISDDGSKLYFNSLYAHNASALVNNDGLHPERAAYGNMYVPAAGSYPIAICFFEKDGGESMQVYWSGPGIPRQPVPASAFTTNALTFSEYADARANTDISLAGSGAQKEAGTYTDDLNKLNEVVMHAYPNPFVDKIAISLYKPSLTKNINIELFDVAGKLIHRQVFKNIAAGYSLLTVVPQKKSLANGVYFVRLNADGMPLKTLRLVKNKGRQVGY